MMNIFPVLTNDTSLIKVAIYRVFNKVQIEHHLDISKEQKIPTADNN